MFDNIRKIIAEHRNKKALDYEQRKKEYESLEFFGYFKEYPDRLNFYTDVIKNKKYGG